MKHRYIEESDIEACAKIFERVFSSEPWNEPWTFDAAYKRLNHFFESKGFFGVLAEEGSGQVIAFVLGNKEPFCHGELYYLREMCVDNEHQSSGIGSSLSSYLDETLANQDIKGMYLATGEKIPAASFYQKNGFKVSDDMAFYSKRFGS